MLYHFLKLYPDNISKIKSQIYDSPCHLIGTVPSLNKMYGIPENIGKIIVDNIFSDCKRTSEAFMKNPLINDIPTGLITSENDNSPNISINKMIDNWEIDDLKRLKTDSKHLESFKDYPQEYKKFCKSISNDF